MIRHFASADELSNDILSLSPSDYRHLVGSLRIKPGTHLGIVIDESLVIEATVTAILKSSLSLTEVTRYEAPLPPFHLDLALAVTKQDAFSETLNSCSQLHVSSYQPLITSRTVPRFSEADIPQKLSRWKSIIFQASRQCHRYSIPSINRPKTLAQFTQMLHPSHYDLILFLNESETTQSLKSAIQITSRINRCLAIIGPEGGFSPSEADCIVKAGAQSVSIGTTILKAPQAAFFLSSILHYELS